MLQAGYQPKKKSTDTSSTRKKKAKQTKAPRKHREPPPPSSPTHGLALLMNRNPIIHMYFQEMIQQQAIGSKGDSDHPRFESVQQLLDCIDVAVASAPTYNDTGLVGFPVNALLYYMMATPAGFACFRETEVNLEFQRILNHYGAYLKTDASASVLNNSPTGWFSPEALSQLHLEEIKCDPTSPTYGFKNWNDFFIRQFKDDARKVEEPDDDKVMVSGCESTPFGLQKDVKLYDQFWLKEQPYSLHDILNGDHLVHEFVGGVVYQAFLSALNYHRWHSPVSGTIYKDPVVIPGTYYSEAESEGLDVAGPDLSQGYLTAVAARSLVFIVADDPTIGLFALTHVGMAEVSSCVFSPHIKKGQHVKKGEEIGRFEFGGSTHALIFRPGSVDFDSFPKPDSGIVKLNVKLAVASDHKKK